MVYCVSLAPELVVVRRVLTVFLGSLKIDLFFSASNNFTVSLSNPSWIRLPEPVKVSNSIDEVISSSIKKSAKIFVRGSVIKSAVKS